MGIHNSSTYDAAKRPSRGRASNCGSVAKGHRVAQKMSQKCRLVFHTTIEQVIFKKFYEVQNFRPRIWTLILILNLISAYSKESKGSKSELTNLQLGWCIIFFVTRVCSLEVSWWYHNAKQWLGLVGARGTFLHAPGSGPGLGRPISALVAKQPINQEVILVYSNQEVILVYSN